MELAITGELVRVVLDNPFKTEGLDYWKHVTGLDRSKIRRGGYAYQGNFISGEVDLPVGALVMEGLSTQSSRWNPRTVKKFARLYRVNRDGLELLRGPKPEDDGSTSLSRHNLSFFEFVEAQLTGVHPNAKVLELDSFTDRELLMALSLRGYFTISEANEILETHRAGYVPELPPPDERCRRLKVDGEQCRRRARKGFKTCWQHPEPQR